jgi:hypothetical protein
MYRVRRVRVAPGATVIGCSGRGVARVATPPWRAAQRGPRSGECPVSIPRAVWGLDPGTTLAPDCEPRWQLESTTCDVETPWDSLGLRSWSGSEPCVSSARARAAPDKEAVEAPTADPTCCRHPGTTVATPVAEAVAGAVVGAAAEVAAVGAAGEAAAAVERVAAAAEEAVAEAAGEAVAGVGRLLRFPRARAPARRTT